MSYGLMPSHNDEWKEKHKIRSFFEERLIEIRDVFLYFFLTYYNARDSVAKTYSKVDKKLMMNILLAIFIAIMLVI